MVIITQARSWGKIRTKLPESVESGDDERKGKRQGVAPVVLIKNQLGRKRGGGGLNLKTSSESKNGECSDYTARH